jgi:guanine deaminase
MSFCATSNLFLGSGLFDLDAAREAGVTVGIGSDVGGGTALSLLRTLNESYKVLQMRGQRLPALQGFYLITLGGARALARVARDFEERLFMLMMLGDDRAVHATYVMGEPAYRATG